MVEETIRTIRETERQAQKIVEERQRNGPDRSGMRSSERQRQRRKQRQSRRKKPGRSWKRKPGLPLPKRRRS